MNFKWEHSKIFAILISLFFIGCDALQFEPPIETSSITVTSPNGYEEWTQGSTNTITWTSENLNGYVDIHLYRSSSHNGYYSFYQYIDNYSNNDGSHTWTISDSLSASYYYKVRIEEHDNSSVYDESDSYFSITIAPSITVISPNGGETWEPGSSQTITWTSENLSSYVRIYLYESGSLYTTIDSYDSNDGSYSWYISTSVPESDYYKVRIQDYYDSDIYDESDSYFAINEDDNSSSTGFILNINASNISGENYTMYFGFVSTMTDEYDQGTCSNSEFSEYGDCLNSGASWYGDQYAPPAPPLGTFDAALTWGSDRYYSQLLDGSAENDGVEHEFGISLAFDSANSITVSWNNSGWDSLLTTAVLQDAFGGAMINVDMLTETSWTVDNPAFTTLLLKVTPIIIND